MPGGYPKTICLVLLLFATICNHSWSWHDMTYMNPLHPLFIPGSGDQHNLKVLVVVIDNRHIHPGIAGNQGFGSLVAALQYRYCQIHGYDYLRLINDKTNFRNELKTKYPDLVKQQHQENTFDKFDDAKYGIDVFHPGYNRTRTSSWGKMLGLWYVIKKVGHRYDYVWFMDSDATPNPIQGEKSLSDMLNLWNSNVTKYSQHGAFPMAIPGPAAKNATFLFLSNFPYRDDLPCAGTIIIRPSQLSLDALREWWDLDLIYKARDDFMEQDALWYILDGQQWDDKFKFLMNSSTVAVLNEHQFASAWQGYSTLWFAHISSGEENRYAYFRTLLSVLGIRHDDHFNPLIEHIMEHNVAKVSFLYIAEEMEKLRVPRHPNSIPREITSKRGDLDFHQPRNADKRPPVADIGTLYNGFLVQREGDKMPSLVYGGKRHLLESEHLMRKMGFEPAHVIVFRVHKHWNVHFLQIERVPFGDPVPPEGIVVPITKSYTLRPLF